MQTVEIDEGTALLADYIAAMNNESIILTVGDKPVAALIMDDARVAPEPTLTKTYDFGECRQLWD